VRKATYGEVCTTCDDTVGLSCNTGNYCVCNTTGNYFWNGTYCGMKKTFYFPKSVGKNDAYYLILCFLNFKSLNFRMVTRVILLGIVIRLKAFIVVIQVIQKHI